MFFLFKNKLVKWFYNVILYLNDSFEGQKFFENNFKMENLS
jgi:hypothetical protein